MNIVQHTLPDSNWVVHINTEPSWGEYQDIENFFVYRTSKNVNQAQEVAVVVDGQLQKEHGNLVFSTMIKKIEDAEGKNLPVNEKTMRDLSITDGAFIDDLLAATWEDTKKKLKKTV